MATTYEPVNHDRVVFNADALVRATISANSPLDNSARLRIQAHVAGERLPPVVTIRGYYALKVGSYNPAHPITLTLPVWESCYFFLRKSERKGDVLLASPGDGYACAKESALQSSYLVGGWPIVPEAVYVQSQVAIFNAYHGKRLDEGWVSSFVAEQLNREPLAMPKWDGSSVAEQIAFSLQHVAMALVFHTRAAGLDSRATLRRLEPYLSASAEHQAAAAQAIGVVPGAESEALLLEFLRGSAHPHAKARAVWELERRDARYLLPQLEAVATTVEAKLLPHELEELIKFWKRGLPTRAPLQLAIDTPAAAVGDAEPKPEPSPRPTPTKRGPRGCAGCSSSASSTAFTSAWCLLLLGWRRVVSRFGQP